VSAIGRGDEDPIVEPCPGAGTIIRKLMNIIRDLPERKAARLRKGESPLSQSWMSVGTRENANTIELKKKKKQGSPF